MKNKEFKEIIKFINYLDSLSEEDRKMIEKGDLVIEYTLTPRSPNSNASRSNVIEEFNGSEVIKRLESMCDKEKGKVYLESLNLRKVQYEKILKELDSPFDKKDNIARLISKIIEATIGFRLRSQAIQGTTD
ncbi:MAG: hypothetical protein K2N05_06865 [Muribaculaceae bacterium]|nr:hypothetical protein [Muribaculaceae bacterium]